MATEQLLKHYTELDEKVSTIFGKLYLAKRREDARLVAIKEDNRSKRSDEAQIHATLSDHPHIVQYLGHYADKRRCYIVMEYCEHGSLKDLLDEHGPLPLRCAQQIFKQVVNALEHIHSKQLLYRNLEPYHLLIHTIDENGDISIKLCDFGAARPMQNQKLGLLQTSVDFKSLGSLLFFMITGVQFINTPEVYEKLASFSESSADLIKTLLGCDAKFSFDDIKSHPFFSTIIRGEESFCNDELSELYNSLLGELGDEEDEKQDRESEFDQDETENDENALGFAENALQSGGNPRNEADNSCAKGPTRNRLCGHETSLDEQPSFQSIDQRAPTPPNTPQTVSNESSQQKAEKLTKSALPLGIEPPAADSFGDLSVDADLDPSSQPPIEASPESISDSILQEQEVAEVAMPTRVIVNSHQPARNDQASNRPKEASIFACFLAVMRALCGYK